MRDADNGGKEKKKSDNKCQMWNEGTEPGKRAAGNGRMLFFFKLFMHLFISVVTL